MKVQTRGEPCAAGVAEPAAAPVPVPLRSWSPRSRQTCWTLCASTCCSSPRCWWSTRPHHIHDNTEPQPASCAPHDLLSAGPCSAVQGLRDLVMQAQRAPAGPHHRQVRHPQEDCPRYWQGPPGPPASTHSLLLVHRLPLGACTDASLPSFLGMRILPHDLFSPFLPLLLCLLLPLSLLLKQYGVCFIHLLLLCLLLKVCPCPGPQPTIAMAR